MEQFPACVNPGNCFSYSSIVIVLSSKVVLSLMGFLLYICTDWYLSKNSRGSSNADFWNILFAYLSLHILTALEFPNFDLCVFNHCGGQTEFVLPVLWCGSVPRQQGQQWWGSPHLFSFSKGSQSCASCCIISENISCICFVLFSSCLWQFPYQLKFHGWNFFFLHIHQRLLTSDSVCCI